MEIGGGTGRWGGGRDRRERGEIGREGEREVIVMGMLKGTPSKGRVSEAPVAFIMFSWHIDDTFT